MRPAVTQHGADHEKVLNISDQDLDARSIKCPKCGESNMAADVRCWACDAELHPAPEPQAEPSPAHAEATGLATGTDSGAEAHSVTPEPRRDDRKASPTGAAFFTGYCLGGASVAVVLRHLPPWALPEIALAAWIMLMVACLGEIYARERRGVLARGRAFTLAGCAVYFISLGLITDASWSHVAWPLALIKMLLYLMIATTGLDIAALIRARLRGLRPRDVPVWYRWAWLACGAMALLDSYASGSSSWW
jgi:hypothetical protein